MIQSTSSQSSPEDSVVPPSIADFQYDILDVARLFRRYTRGTKILEARIRLGIALAVVLTPLTSALWPGLPGLSFLLPIVPVLGLILDGTFRPWLAKGLASTWSFGGNDKICRLILVADQFSAQAIRKSQAQKIQRTLIKASRFEHISTNERLFVITVLGDWAVETSQRDAVRHQFRDLVAQVTSSSETLDSDTSAP